MHNSACAFTGHRPVRFSFGYDERDDRCVKIKAMMSEQIGALIARGVTELYVGGAQGVDQWAAEIVLDSKKEHPILRLIAVLPCKTQADRWSAEQRNRYCETLARCDKVVILHERYTHSCMFERNRYMVDRARYLLAVYDGGSDGGTAFTVEYAKQQGRRITIIHPDTLEVTDQ
jgi:uncharacterized phage-like protein YoqJ